MGHGARLGQDNIEVEIVGVVGRAASILPGHTIAFFLVVVVVVVVVVEREEETKR